MEKKIAVIGLGYVGLPISVNGDGETSRDFTYVQNAVQMNDLSLFTNNREALNQIYNTACSDRISLNEMINELAKATQATVNVKYGPERKGDVKHSEASIEKARKHLGYNPNYSFNEGLLKTVEWYKNNVL